MPPYTSPMMPAAINRIAAILSALTVPPFALEDAPAGDEPDDQDDDGDDEQDVDEAAHRVGGNHAEQPQYKQNDENRPEHFSPPVPPDLVLHVADEEFVVHTLDAHRAGCDATRVVLDHLGTDTTDQRHYALRGTHIDVPRLDLGVGDHLHLVVGLQRRLDHRRDPRVRVPRLLRHHRGGAPDKRQYPDTHQRACHHNQPALHEIPSFPEHGSNLALQSPIRKSTYYPGATPPRG